MCYTAKGNKKKHLQILISWCPIDGIRQLLNSDAKVLLFFYICKKNYKKMNIYLHNSKKSSNFELDLHGIIMYVVQKSYCERLIRLLYSV